METLQQLIDCDLDHIRANLRDEFTAMAGKRLLLTGGAGFLGSSPAG
jgi:hypothetical protein